MDKRHYSCSIMKRLAALALSDLPNYDYLPKWKPTGAQRLFRVDGLGWPISDVSIIGYSRIHDRIRPQRPLLSCAFPSIRTNLGRPGVMVGD